jgi:hypothetical protein
MTYSCDCSGDVHLFGYNNANEIHTEILHFSENMNQPNKNENNCGILWKIGTLD